MYAHLSLTATHALDLWQRQLITKSWSGRWLLGPLSPAKNLTLSFLQQYYCKTSSACGLCRDCQQVISLSHPKMVYIQAGQDKSIAVENIRALHELIHLRNTDLYQSIIIDNLGKLTPPGVQALLRLLEIEQDSTSIFLFTKQWFGLPDALLSRCQRLLIQDHNTAAGIAEIICQEPPQQLFVDLHKIFVEMQPCCQYISQWLKLWQAKVLYWLWAVILYYIGCKLGYYTKDKQFIISDLVNKYSVNQLLKLQDHITFLARQQYLGCNPNLSNSLEYALAILEE